MKRIVQGWWPLLALLLIIPSSMRAQAVYGSIFGTVTDATGAAIPNANIIVTDPAKGTSVTVHSNDSGEFTADHLIPDTYNLKVDSQGFKGYEQNGIRVFADTSAKILAALTIGSAGQTVEVNADQVPQLKTDRADVSTVFTSQELANMPIPDRNFANLQLLLPGAQELGWSHAADENPQGSKQIEIDGQAFAGVAYELDGTDNQDPILGIIVVNPNMDSLSEAKITTQNFDAQFGKAVSSVVTAQTKSGTNRFHGSAFDYRESNANLARDPFSQHTANSVPAGLKNQFGGSIGGPIFKDRLFFFGDYQGVRQKAGISQTATVPSAYLVSTCLGQTPTNTGVPGCDFSEYATAQGGSSYQLLYNNSGDGPSAYPGNVIPAADVSPQAIALLTLLQPYAPNTNSGGSFGALKSNYSAGGTGGFNSDQWDARGDWTLSARTHVFGRFSRFTDLLSGTTIFGPAGGTGFGLQGYGGTSTGANDSLAAGADVALTSKTATDVRLGYFRYNIITGKYDQNVQFANQLGIPGLNTGTNFTSGAPGFILADPNSFGGGNNTVYGSGLNINRCNCTLVEREDQFQIANNWTHTIGNHEIKFGADLRYARNLRVPSDNNRTGLLYFGTGPTSNGQAGSNTGLGFASFLLGDVTTFQRYVSTSTNAKEFQKRDFFYAQDTWRPSSKMTVNYGLRYEFYFPESVNGKGNGSLMNLATGYLQVAGYGNIKSDMNQGMAPNTWAPRIGIAYQMRPTSVIRAGYGRSFDIGVFGSVFGHSATQNLPVLSNQQLTAPGGDNATDTAYAFNLANGPSAPVFPTVPANGLLPNPGTLVSSHSRPTTLRLPTLDAWNLSLQQAFTPTLSLTIAYVGNKGTHTFGDASGNTTNPNEAGDFLPSQYSVNGSALHYDPSVSQGTIYPGQTVAGISTDNGTANATLLQRYYGGKLAGCSDPDYVAVGGTPAPNGGCGWTNSIQYYGDNEDTHYNALQVTLTKQIAHGYSLNANYAWQQSMDEATGYSTWDRRAVYGRDSELRQQQIIVYGLLDLPFGRNHLIGSHVNGVVNEFIGGWQVDPVVNYSSGLPFTLSYNGCTGQNVSGAPCYLDGDAHQFHSQVTGFPGNGLQFYPQFTASADGSTFTAPGEGTFHTPAVDQFGNVGRDTAFGPHFFDTDLTLEKVFPIHESFSAKFEVDAYNAFNHINWGTPNGNIQNGGSITSGPFPTGSNPRQLQFSLRFDF